MQTQLAPQTNRFRRVPRTSALDGLRALAIVAVALFHYPTRSVFKGGLFGVGVFFVLSGFLITPIVMSEFSREGRVRLGSFYRRRAWRLVPALGAFLVVVVAMAFAFGHEGWFASTPFAAPHAPGRPLSGWFVLGAAAAALSYIYNFFMAFSVHMPQPFGHLWTLSVEGQFYLLWAALVAWLLRYGTRVLIGVTAALAALSAASPFLVWHPGAQNWIYFGTVPRIQQLLAGALLAELWSVGAFDRVPRRLVGLGALAGAGGLSYLVFAVGDERFKYLGALTVVAVGGLAVVAYLVDDRGRSPGRAVLSWRPLVWLGQRSYALYLWHWPLALWTNRLPHHVGVPLGLGASVLAAELSWRLVEAPAAALARKRSARAARTAGSAAATV